VIHDYKFDPAIKDRRRGHGRGRFVVLALAVLAAAAALLHFSGALDGSRNNAELQNPEIPTVGLPADEEQSAPAGHKVSIPLELPPARQTTPAAQPAATPAQPAPQPQVERAERSLLQSMPDTSAEEAVAQTGDKPGEQAHAATEHDTAAMPEMGPRWLTHTISRGESLARIFQARDLSASLLHRIVNSSKTAQQLADIRPGQELRFLLDDENGLEAMILVKSPVESLHIRATGDDFAAELVSKAVERRIASATGTIESSLFVDGQKAGLTDAQIMELAALFGWDIDFALEIRAGDQFRLLYEEQFLDGEKFRNGPILAAEFVNQGKTYQALRFEDDQGSTGYYDAEGRNKRRAFIRTPIKFARISSRFTPKRWHPVLKRWRSHKGVDYAAPTGTPIKATGEGKVIFRGWKGGYGRVVIVQHGSKYQTLYAHMSKFSRAKAGSKVKQGQIIGYVGKSGLATGPHLHYEFRVDGVHRNPLTVKLPKSLPLPESKLAAFKQQTAPLVAQLASVAQGTMVASSEQ